MKQKLFKIVMFFKKDSGMAQLVRIVLSAMILVLVICLFFAETFGELVATAVSLSATALVLYSGKALMAFFEDKLKLSGDTEELLKLYKSGDYRKTVTLNNTQMDIAYDPVFINRDNLPLERFKVEDDPNKHFGLDGFVEGNFAQLYSAHSNSFKRNGDTIRLDDFTRQREKGETQSTFVFRTSRSTYYNHLVTNRVADFALFDDVTLRSMYEYRGEHTPLAESKMSNHIGVNGLVYLSDGNLLIPQRDKDSTISKNKVTSSIAVLLNFPTDSKTVTAEHLLKGTVMDNLCTRARLQRKDCPENEVDIRFLGFGRNVYEAGKPQFYYEVHLKNIDAKKYRELTEKWEKSKEYRLDVDKCIYVADPSTMKFEKGKLRFRSAEGKKKSYLLDYEMSYLCNLWQAAEVRWQNKRPEKREKEK